ncbi:uncharacterized protein LOC134676936 [Cydia fagiglandana]|uniref:uncharacterized protein LOC134676936 n=1 Tax=Cydia fagiglandana TaxID=1458189 RepID=UPI002FEE5CFC
MSKDDSTKLPDLRTDVATSSTADVCAKCHETLPKRDRLTCCACERTYDLPCANVYHGLFDLMSTERKLNWTCKLCRNAPKTGKTSTPIKNTLQNYVSMDDWHQLPDTDSDDSNVTIRNKGHTLHSLDDSLLIISRKDPDLSLKKNNEVLSDIILTELRSFRSQMTLQLEQQEQRFTNLADKIETNISNLFQKYATLKTELNNIKLSVDATNIQTDNILRKSNSNFQRIDETNKKILTLEHEMASLKLQTQLLENKLKSSGSDRIVPSNKTEQPSNNNYVRDSPNHNFTGPSHTEYVRRLVLYGLNEHDRESKPILIDQVLNLFYDIYNIDLTGQIEEIWRIGRRGFRRPIVIELLSKRMTKYIIENASYLKYTGLFVSEFLDRDSLRTRKLLREKLREVRQTGQSAVIRNNKLFVNGKEMPLQEVYADNEDRNKTIPATTLNSETLPIMRLTGDEPQQTLLRNHPPTPNTQPASSVKTFRP